MKDEPLVSVVVITHHGQNIIGKALSSIFDASYPNKEVIVVANDPDDPSLEVAKEFPVRIYSSERDGGRILGEKGRGFGYQRDLGWRVARGELIAYCDSDKPIEKEWFNKMLKHFDNPIIGGVTGIDEINSKSLLLTGMTGYSWALYYTSRLLSGFSRIRMIKGANTIWRRGALEQVDGFDRKLADGMGEDTDLSYRIIKKGWVLLMADAVSYHYEDKSLREWLMQRKKEGSYSRRIYNKNEEKPSVLLTLYILIIGILLTPKICWNSRSLKSLLWPLPFIGAKLFRLSGLLSKETRRS